MLHFVLLPGIHAGYFSRYYILRSLLLKFIALHTKSNQRHQVIVLGAGYDTTFFQLYKEGVIPTNGLIRYVELDFMDVTVTKVLALQQCSELKNLLSSFKIECTSDTASASISPFYHILPTDLRDIEQLQHTVLNTAGIDPFLPTFILAECVLVYMTSAEGSSLLSWLASTFSSSSAIAVYEQINPNDPFGHQMMINTRQRGCPLIGIQESLGAWELRLTQVAGWERADAKSMRQLYACGVDGEEMRRIRSLEIFDEFEEWDLIQDHYCVALGVNCSGKEVKLSSDSAGDDGTGTSPTQSRSLLKEFCLPS